MAKNVTNESKAPETNGESFDTKWELGPVMPGLLLIFAHGVAWTTEIAIQQYITPGQVKYEEGVRFLGTKAQVLSREDIKPTVRVALNTTSIGEGVLVFTPESSQIWQNTNIV